MLMRKFAATAWLLVAVVASTAGTAAAEPEGMGVTASADGIAATDGTGLAEVVGFTATATGDTAVIGIDAGALVIADDVLEIRSDDGIVLAGTPLRFRVDDFEFPIAAEISGRTAALTPQLALDKARYRPVALPFEDKAPWKNEYDREQAAWSRMTSTIGLGVSMGALLGGLGGAAVGCVLGGIAGATVAAATIAGLFGPFLPAAAVGCLGGIAAIGALGAVAGQLFVTAPVAIAAVAQYFTTINAPFPAK
ncbi:hypothetical protein [Nocardia bhagyanarayanae]|uniref:DUF8020 domain-containing protein n=1 Tax=Nocardia bhagyanarayanae TaxID=1215925 RepID=A0A543F6F3_9NOCA|nr:hypothetical protein [Nocardia bhagyanarayanae]TQM29414.1 hypothetical protein FB390_1016 [Nocardia bhagyanarayanae]